MTHLLLRRARLVGESATGDHAVAEHDGAAALVGHGALVDVSVRNGRIEAIRPADGSPARGRGERPVMASDAVVDLAGQWLLPGFWDCHVHLLQHALAARRLDLSGATSAAHALDRVAARLAARLAARPPIGDEVLVGFGHRAPTWPDVPTLAALDAIARGWPVVLVSADLHSAWLSSAALTRFGRRAGADGIVREEDFFAIWSVLDGGSPDERDGWVRQVAEQAAARGVVGVADMEAEDPREWGRRLAGVTDYPLRVRSAVWPEDLESVLAQFGGPGAGAGDRGRGGSVAGARLAPVTDRAGRATATLGPLKVITDGSLTTATAYCDHPYPGGGRGVLNVEPERLTALLRRASQAGLEGAVHALGDAAVALAVDAFAAAGATGSIEHAQLVRWSDVDRMARLGLRASVQPAHLLDDRDTIERFWPGRAERVFPLATLLAAGVQLTLGSDAPVAPLDPLLAVAAAVRRTSEGRSPWHPEQRLDPVAALAASTGGHGVRPRPGQVADLVVLADDPVAWARDGEGSPLVVTGTLLAGEWTHRAG